MTQHDFIFSNRFRHRLARHAAFWFASWVLFLIIFYIPFGIFSAWNTEQFSKNIARIGLPKWLWMRVMNSSLSLFPILLFAYTLIYFLLPRFFFNKKNRLVTVVLFVGMFAFIYVLQHFVGWVINITLVKNNPAKVMPSTARSILIINKMLIFNCPVIGGCAVIIKMMKRTWLKRQETRQIEKEKANAELQLLKAQIHPHFLFNTLNNIYFFTLTASRKAPEILTKLNDILRYILNECSQPLVPLEKEIKMIEDYITLEKIRYGDRLKMDVVIKGDFSNKMIPPLLLIPLVENSFKHGASKMLEQPWVNLNITVDGSYLFLILSNSRPDEISQQPHFGHIGLNNVKKRLALLYPGAHELNIVAGVSSFEIFMKINLRNAAITLDEEPIKKEMLVYAVA